MGGGVVTGVWSGDHLEDEGDCDSISSVRPEAVPGE